MTETQERHKKQYSPAPDKGGAREYYHYNERKAYNSHALFT